MLTDSTPLPRRGQGAGQRVCGASVPPHRSQLLRMILDLSGNNLHWTQAHVYRCLRVLVPLVSSYNARARTAHCAAASNRTEHLCPRCGFPVHVSTCDLPRPRPISICPTATRPHLNAPTPHRIACARPGQLRSPPAAAPGATASTNRARHWVVRHSIWPYTHTTAHILRWQPCAVLQPRSRRRAAQPAAIECAYERVPCMLWPVRVIPRRQGV